MKITRKSDVTHIEKPEGTSVDYFLFDDFELHYNEQAPHTTQMWHKHAQIWESLYIIDGELVARWRDEAGEHESVVRAGDYVESERSVHTFENVSDKPVRFVVMKRMPTGKNYRETFKTDKITDV